MVTRREEQMRRDQDRRRAQASETDAPEVHDEQTAESYIMEVGTSATLTVSFQDAMGGDVNLKKVNWTASEGLAITPDPEDPTTASVFATAAGSSTVTAHVEGEIGGRGTTQIPILIRSKGTPHVGAIAFSNDASEPPPVEPPPEEPPPEEPPVSRGRA